MRWTRITTIVAFSGAALGVRAFGLGDIMGVPNCPLPVTENQYIGPSVPVSWFNGENWSEVVVPSDDGLRTVLFSPVFLDVDFPPGQSMEVSSLSVVSGASMLSLFMGSSFDVRDTCAQSLTVGTVYGDASEPTDTQLFLQGSSPEQFNLAGGFEVQGNGSSVLSAEGLSFSAVSGTISGGEFVAGAGSVVSVGLLELGFNGGVLVDPDAAGASFGTVVVEGGNSTFVVGDDQFNVSVAEGVVVGTEEQMKIAAPSLVSLGALQTPRLEMRRFSNLSASSVAVGGGGPANISVEDELLLDARNFYLIDEFSQSGGTLTFTNIDEDTFAPLFLQTGFLGGTLRLEADEDYVPTVGEQFTLIQGSSFLIGEPTLVESAGLPDGFYFELELNVQTPTNGRVSDEVIAIVQQLAFNVDFAVPEVFPLPAVPVDEEPIAINKDAFIDVAVLLPGASQQQTGEVLLQLNLGNDGAGEWLGYVSSEVGVPTGPDPVALAIGDLDNDGLDDIAVANRGDDTISIILNDGKGGFFTDLVISTNADDARDLTILDIDLDGDNDIAIIGVSDANNPETLGVLEIWENQAVTAGGVALVTGFVQGDFIEFEDDPTSIDPTDIDNDKPGDLDLLISIGGVGTSPNDRVLVVENQEGTVMPAGEVETDGRPAEVVSADLDGDGLVDIITANESNGTVTIIKNIGDFDFLPVAQIEVGTGAISIDVVDIDTDGDVDVPVVVQTAGLSQLFLLRNDENGNGTITFTLEGPLVESEGALRIDDADVNDDGLDDLVGSQLNIDVVQGEGSQGVNPAWLYVYLNESVVNLGSCPTDLDGSKQVGVEDLAILLDGFNQGTAGDVDGDGDTDSDDLGSLLTTFGDVCPGAVPN